MEVVRKVVDANSLMSFMNLPKTFRNRKLEVIVLPVEENSEEVKKTADVSTVVQSLIGIIPNDNNMTLEDYREERLRKYEAVD
ncbi:MAG: hypothetical protein EGR89_05610 [[Eubacterium] rectale]|nr:hypothetical protein [Agathobacter rectalis]